MSSSAARVAEFRAAIRGFIEARRDEKLKGKDDDAAWEKFEVSTWLEDAARRASQIQVVTHPVKATHTGARGSSLYVAPSSLAPRGAIGTHSLAGAFADDVVGNAAALDVYKFLKTEVQGRRLLDWAVAGDADLAQALHADAAIGAAWRGAFANLVRAEETLSTHALAKQVFWRRGADACSDADYLLLLPLFSSSLEHAVSADIGEVRFGESMKEVRAARKEGRAHALPLREYRGLVMRRLGGTKPQNVSQLNSERRGQNHLLSCAPPSWKITRAEDAQRLSNALTRFAQLPSTRALVRGLASFLRSEPAANERTRARREGFEMELGGRLAAFGAELQASLPAGWSRDSSCRLPVAQQHWLDPERAELPVRPEQAERDEAFRREHLSGAWASEIADAFAAWLNAELHRAGVVLVGEVEHRHWAKQMLSDAAGLELAGSEQGARA